MRIEKEKTVAFSGYRASKLLSAPSSERSLFSFEGNRPPTTLQTISNGINSAIRELYGKGYRNFMSGMSDGFDMMAAQAVIDLRSELSDICLIAVVPFRGQEATYTIADAREYRAILNVADEVLFLAEKYESKLQYLHRNDYMLEHSSHLVCYYDGQRGGTMYTYNKAKKLGLNILNLCEL